MKNNSMFHSLYHKVDAFQTKQETDKEKVRDMIADLWNYTQYHVKGKFVTFKTKKATILVDCASENVVWVFYRPINSIFVSFFFVNKSSLWALREQMKKFGRVAILKEG